MAEPVPGRSRIEITQKDLPLHCPMTRTPVWSNHPRVFLQPGADGESRCPYCGTVYVVSGTARAGH
ncbi:MAG: zinc-finger domain-containing protein [Betaproteobacteria bacterium]|nr:zinc-finger domain-containing protein [Betaproteobacteria bacterium]